MVATKDEIRRERAPAPDPVQPSPPGQRLVIPAKRDDESVRDYIIRLRAADAARGVLDGDPAVLSPELEERIAALERLDRRREENRRLHGVLDNSTESIRRSRDERSRRLAGR